MDHRTSTKKTILITGGTGLIGSRLTALLLEKGYAVNHLSRRKTPAPGTNTFYWDLDKDEIDERCVDGADIIIHLAGEGIADKRWTEERKKAITESRTKSIRLIYDLLKRKQHRVKSVISASAIGYYSDRGEELLTEDSAPNDDFMARCCVEWEAAVEEGKELGLRVAKYRTGVVLDSSGALEKMAAPVKWYVGAPLGNGKQWIPWIHVQDVINMYLFAIEHENFEGIYNMVAPNPVTNKQLTKSIAKQLNRRLWLPNVPAFLLKLFLGEMSTIVLGSTKVSAQKIEAAGFEFKYTEVEDALKQIYG
ncbi:MAG TPA: TIGR01777 family oxidoreductase [Mucilaginibacter sp.]|jgi:hypothetical protein|nr:TIGR01777 family oxidoreductase [Mucilaginibacter sp.]